MSATKQLNVDAAKRTLGGSAPPLAHAITRFPCDAMSQPAAGASPDWDESTDSKLLSGSMGVRRSAKTGPGVVHPGPASSPIAYLNLKSANAAAVPRGDP